MDVRIGVTQSPKELSIELPEDASQATVKADIAKALAKGEMLWITDKKGRQVGVPADKIAYVEVGHPDDDRKIGFGST